MACYGNQAIRMPNLNRLADEAVVFEEPYCTQPVCTPARGSILTGLWPHSHGATTNNIPLNADAACLPELLATAEGPAYRTAYMGKWHLGDEIFPQHGFDEWVSIEDGYYPFYSSKRDTSRRSTYHHFLREHGFQPAKPPGGFTGFGRSFAAQLPERYSKPQLLSSRASNFIRNNQGRPWLLTVNFLEPHTPNQSCRDDQYDPDDVYLPDNLECFPNEDQPPFLRQIRENKVLNACGPTTREAWRQYTAAYWGLNSLVDTHVGRILDALDATGQRDNTIVVFSSDHGEMLGSHGLLYKNVMFKEATQVPLLIRLPGEKTGGRVSGPVSHIDLVPTLLDLMGRPDAAHDLPGRSLAELCRKAASGDTVSANGTASDCVIEWNPGKQACKSTVRTLITPEGERYSHYADGEREYYDLRADPGETRNLAREQSAQPRISELCERLADWQKRTGDTGPPVCE